MLSVITVCYRAGDLIAQTIESVLMQQYTDYEYVFVDGGSKDHTLSVIESYRERFEEKGIRYHVVSEPDQGVYDAMNKGVGEACGQWVLMMNAGDRFADGEVLWKVFSEDRSAQDVIYGDVVLCEGECYKVSRAQPLENMLQGMPFCHQCVFAKREILAQYGFDLQFRLAADYHQMLRCYLDGKVFQYIPQLISVYDVAGVSERNFKTTLIEQELVGEALGVKTQQQRWKTLLMRRVVKLLRVLLPGWMRSEKRGWYDSLEKAKCQYEMERNTQ